MDLLKKAPALGRSQAGLPHQRLTQWVMALDQVFVSGLQALEQAHRRDLTKLAHQTTIALGAGEHEVPDPVQVDVEEMRLERLRDEMIDLSEAGIVGQD
jgi:hypothetical protein